MILVLRKLYLIVPLVGDLRGGWYIIAIISEFQKWTTFLVNRPGLELAPEEGDPNFRVSGESAVPTVF